MNLTKFGSLHLATPSSRYECLKFAFKSVKNKSRKHFKNRLTLGPMSQRDPHVSDTQNTGTA